MTLKLNAKCLHATEVKISTSRSLPAVDGAAIAERKTTPGGIGAPPTTPAVSAAEQRVVNLVAKAWTNKEIAAALGLSPATVKRHIEKILTKLELRNRVELAIYGVTANSCPHQLQSGCALRDLISEEGPGV